MEREVVGPFKGAANNSAFIKTPADLVPVEGILNVRLDAPGSDRPRFGQRPGLIPQFNQELGGGNPVQAFGVVRRSSGTAAYERLDSTAQAMAFSDTNDPFRYSRQASRFARSGAAPGPYDGDPYAAFVASGNLSIDRAFGRLNDDDPAGGGPPLDQRGNPMISLDRPLHANEGAGPITMSDILCVSGRFGTGGTNYDEPAAADHQVIMGLQVAWHRRAGVADNVNRHTLVFTSLIAPGTLTTGPATYTVGALYTSITAVNADTGAILWRNTIKDMDPLAAVDTAIRNDAGLALDDPAGVNIFTTNTPNSVIAKHLTVDDDYTYVCAGPYIYVFNTTSGKYLQRATIGSTGSNNGWAKETQCVMLRRGRPRDFKNLTGLTGTKSLLCLFVGSNLNTAAIQDNTTGTGPLPGSDDARYVQAISHWRSGLAEFKIDETGIDTVNTVVLTRQKFPGSADPQPTETVPETNGGVAHKTLRFSSVLARRPRGGLAYAACVWPDPSVEYDTGGNPFPGGPTLETIASDAFYVGITNRGYGLSSATPTAMTGANFGTAPGWLWPDSSKAPTTVLKFNGDGSLAWEVDSESLLAEYRPLPVSAAGVVYYNDIPVANVLNGPAATIMGMAPDAAGNIIIAGKRNNNHTQPVSGFNVMKLSATDGRIIWRANLCGIIYQHCVRVSPVDGSIFVVGQRNDTWDDPDGTAGGIHDGTYATLWKLSPADGEVIDTLDLGMNDSLWSAGTAAPDAANNNWLDYCSAVSIDLDQSGRIAFATNPGA